MKKIFITGSSGMVGRSLTSWLYENTAAELYLLKRPGSSRHLNVETDSPRIKTIYGDVTVDDLGISVKDRPLISEADVVIHAAALTDFSATLGNLRSVNVEGLRRVADFSRELKKIEKFACFSTLYVAGRQEGKIFENNLSDLKGFVNNYEKSKFEAEKLISKYQSELPISVYRLSTLLGDSRNGAVGSFTAPHRAFQMLWLGLTPMVPGLKETKLDFMPVDYTAEVIGQLITKHFKPNMTYQLAAGVANSWSVEELIDHTFKCFENFDSSWAARQYPKPSIVDKKTFDLFSKSIQETGNPLFTSILGALESFAEQLVHPKDFDSTNVLTDLPDYYSNMPLIDDYFDKVLHYCLKTKWGRRETTRRTD